MYLFLFFPCYLIKPYIPLFSLHTQTSTRVPQVKFLAFLLEWGMLIFNAYLKYISIDGTLSFLQGLTLDKSFSPSA